MMKRGMVLIVGAALASIGLAVGAQQANLHFSASQDTSQLTRKEAVYKLVMKWGPIASRDQRRSIDRWADDMTPLFGTANIANLNKALAATSYTAMVNTLTGTKAPDPALLVGGRTPALLGSMSSDLVFTPLPSCVIVNTSKPGGGGVMAAGSVRYFKASGTSFISQGGEDSNCGIPPGVHSLLVSVTSATPSTSGYFKLWPYGTTQPLAANLSYTGGQLVQNEIILATSVGLSADFSVYSSGSSHFIANVLGYFAAPTATALDCNTQSSTATSIAAGAVGQAIYPSCDAGYTLTSISCETGNYNTPLSGSGPGYGCTAKNDNGSAISLVAKSTCCRVPGR
jgi:hypothetical protein